jgi:hypothetical protein
MFDYAMHVLGTRDYAGMFRGWKVTTALMVGLLGMGGSTVYGAAGVGAEARTPAAKQIQPAKIPLSFEANQGQTDGSVRFVSRGSGYSMFLTEDEVVLNLERQQKAPGGLGATASLDTLRMQLLGANAGAEVTGTERLPGVVSYFIGNDPKKWHAGIATYGKVSYAQVYPGIDLVFYGNQRQLEYDFVVAPGADPGRIAWRMEGARATIDGDGNLVLAADHGPASFKKPVVYQMEGDKRIGVEGAFTVAGNRVGFRLGAYDRSKALIIDPVLSYSSYLGGSGLDTIGGSVGNSGGTFDYTQALAIDSEGSAYVTGTTYSTDFPTKNPYQGTNTATVADNRNYTSFVTKVSADGTSLVYSTYLGGSTAEVGYAIAVDSSGEAYVTGLTYSNDFPVTAGSYNHFCAGGPKGGPSPNPEISTCQGAGYYSAYVTKLNAAGTALVYSTFLGGFGVQYGVGIAVDSAGRAYVAGISGVSCDDGTPSDPAGPWPYTCFPTTNGAVLAGTTPNGGDAPQYTFISVLDPTGANLLYSSLFGSTNGSSGYGGSSWAGGVTVDSSGNFYLVGSTTSPNLPTTAGVVQPTAGPVNASQPTTLSQPRGFIAKFNPVTATGGATLAYATYLGGKTLNESDSAGSIATDSQGNAYVTGFTHSQDFPVTKGSYQTTCASYICNADYVVKLNSTGTAIDWGTFLGGATGSSDEASSSGPIALDGKGNVYVTGTANGSDFPQANTVEPVPNTDSEQFVTELDPTGATLLFSTLVDNPGAVEPGGLGVSATGDVYLAGNLNNVAGIIVTPGAFQQTYGGGSGDGYVLKFAAQGTATMTFAAAPSPVAAGTAVTLTATVTPAAKYASVPTGTVEFKNGSTTLNTATVNGSGVATFTTSSLAPGKYSLTAAYSGDSTYTVLDGSTTLTVTGLTATVGVTPASTTVSVGSSLGVKVAVTGSGATPTGTVTLVAGSYSSGAQTLSSGDYSFTIPANSLTVGTDSIVVNYSGDSVYGSASGSVSVSVTSPLTPTVKVTPSATTISAASPLTVTAAVTGSGATPTGTVMLSSGSYKSSAQALASGSYAFTIPAGSLSVGTDTLTVSYSGDSSYASATGTASVSVTATPLTPTVKVTPSATSIGTDASLTVTAAVTGAGVTPTGTVTLSGGGYTSTAETLASGTYAFTIPAGSLTAGTDTLTVSYSGDSVYATGTGTTSVTVATSVFTLSATNPAAVAPGTVATSTVTVSTSNAYSGSVSLACALTSSPSGATAVPTCTSSGSVSLSSTTTTGTATMTVNSTSANSASGVADIGGKPWRLGGGGAVLALLVFLGLPNKRRRWQASLMVAIALVVASGLAGCGSSGNKGTTAGAYTFTVTGTGNPSDGSTPTTTFTVTVN